MITKEELKNKKVVDFPKNSPPIPNKKIKLSDKTQNLIANSVLLSPQTRQSTRSKRKSLAKLKALKIEEIGGNFEQEIQNKKDQIRADKKTRRLAVKQAKFSENIFTKFDELVNAWHERKLDLNLLSAHEKRIYRLRPVKSHFFFMIYNKINAIVKKIVKGNYDYYHFLIGLSVNSRKWALSKIPSLKLPYDLKTEKLLVLIEGVDKQDPIHNLYLLKRSTYLYVIDFPDLLENVFEKTINSKIYKLLQLIKISNDPDTLITNTSDNILEVKNGYKIYSSPKNNTTVLKKINLKIKAGEFILLLGPSGSGKTTLMNCLAGIDQLSFGDVVINNNNITKLTDHSLTQFRMNNISYVFQHYGLLPNLNVEENVLVGDFLRSRNYNWKNKQDIINRDRKFVENLLKDFQIYNDRHKMVYELSGGTQQRVSIARSIAKKSKLIFADEPTSALDEKTAAQVIKYLQKACLVYKQTVIMITHDEKNINYASRIIRLKDGKIVEDIRKEILNENKTF